MRCPTVYVMRLLTHGYSDVTPRYLIFSSWTTVGLVMQSDSVGAASEKGVARLQGGHPVAGRQEGLERGVGCHLAVPVALPDDAELVPKSPQGVVFLLGGVVHFLQGPVGMEFGDLLGETPRAPVPQAPVKLVNGAGGGVVPVHVVVGQAAFSSVVDVPDAVRWRGGRRGRRVDAKTMRLPRQPFHRFGGLIRLSSLPASTGFGRDGAGSRGNYFHF